MGSGPKRGRDLTPKLPKLKNMRKEVISVIGGHDCNSEVEQLAHKIGKIVAEVGAILVCGGLGGAMEAACKGAKEANGLTVGIIMSYDKKDANKYCDIVIPTGLGNARNVLVVQSADMVVALPGKYGTLSEIAFALHFGKPLINFSNWDIPGAIKVETVEEAEAQIKKY